MRRRPPPIVLFDQLVSVITTNFALGARTVRDRVIEVPSRYFLACNALGRLARGLLLLLLRHLLLLFPGPPANRPQALLLLLGPRAVHVAPVENINRRTNIRIAVDKVIKDLRLLGGDAPFAEMIQDDLDLLRGEAHFQTEDQRTGNSGSW